MAYSRGNKPATPPHYDALYQIKALIEMELKDHIDVQAHGLSRLPGDPTLLHISVYDWSLPKEEQKYQTKGLKPEEVTNMDVTAMATEILADLKEQKPDWFP